MNRDVVDVDVDVAGGDHVRRDAHSRDEAGTGDPHGVEYWNG